MARSARSARALVALAAGGVAISLLFGATGAEATRTVAQAESDRRAAATRAEQLRTEAASARRQASALGARLVESGRRRAEAEQAATRAEQRLAELRAQMQSEARSRDVARDGFEAALIAAAFAARRLEPRAVRAGIFARAAIPALIASESRSAQALDQASTFAAHINQEHAALAAAQAAIDAERTELAALLQRQRAAQTELAAAATAADRRMRTLASEVRTLRDLAARVRAASQRVARPLPGAASLPAAWLAPAEGQLQRGFGVRDGQGPPSQGVALRTRPGAQVVSPAAGEVAYSGAFRSYGNVLILNLDGGYAVVLTGLREISARVGDRVRAGQPLGEMPEADTPAPELYVEVRRNGRAVDPGRWLSPRGLSAGGARVQAG
jgi:murein hydrolase activator